jgi:hypothetical protein
MNKISARLFFSLKILITALILLIPVGMTLAVEDQPGNIEANNTLPPAEETIFVGSEPIEIVSMRTEVSKTYDNGDGTHTAVIYVKPIHYQSTDGTWEDMDGTSPSPRSGTRTIQNFDVNADGFICNGAGNEDWNMGADLELYQVLDSSTQWKVFRTLIIFNIGGIPSGSEINSAAIKLQYYYSGNAVDINGQLIEGGAADSMTITANALTNSWTEGTGTWGSSIEDGASWNTRDGTNAWSTAGGDFSASLSGTGSTPTSGYGPTTITATSIVDAWTTGTSNYGVILRGTGGDDSIKMFRSSEYSTSSQRPYLEVNYVSNYPPSLNKPLVQNKLELNEDQGTYYLELDGNSNPSEGLFKDADPGDSMDFFVWTGTSWAGQTGGGFVSEIVTASILPNGTLEVKPQKNQYGTELVTLNATDSDDASFEYEIQIKILPINDPPRINDTTNWQYDKPEPTLSPGKINCLEDTWLNCTVTAWDPVEKKDNKNLVYSVNSTEEYASFFEINSNNGKVSFLPLNEYVGIYYLKIMVSDGNDENHLAEFPFTLEIENVNDKPIFTKVQIDTDLYEIPTFSEQYELEEDATEDVPFTFWVHVLDEDLYLEDSQEQLRFSITPTPEFSITTNANYPDQVYVTFTPENKHVGTTSAYLKVTDAESVQSQIELQIEVINQNDPPEFVRFYYKTQDKAIESNVLDLAKLGSGYKATEYSSYVFKVEGMDQDPEDKIKFDAEIEGRSENAGRKMFKIEEIPNNPNTRQITVTPDRQAGREGELLINVTLSDFLKVETYVLIKIPVDNINDAPEQPIVDVEIVDANKKTRQKENLTVLLYANYTSDILFPDPDGDEDLTYTWDYGDDSPEEYGVYGETMEHTYPKSGEYTITITVADPEGLSNTTTKTIEVIKPAGSGPDDNGGGGGSGVGGLGEVSGVPIAYILMIIIVIVILVVVLFFMMIQSKKKEEEEAARAQAAQQQAQMAQYGSYPMAGTYQDPNMMAQYQAYQQQYQQMMMQQYPEQYQQMAQQYGIGQQAATPEQYGTQPVSADTQIQTQPMQQATMAEGQYPDTTGLPTVTEQPQMLPPAEPGQEMEGMVEEPTPEGEPVTEGEPEIPVSPFAAAETQTLEEELGEDAAVAEIPIEPSAEPVPEPEITPEPETTPEPIVEDEQPPEPGAQPEPTVAAPEPTPEPAPEPAPAGPEEGNTCKNCGAAVKEGWFLCPSCKKPLI